MKDIPTKYDPTEKEDKWYKYWSDQGFFHSEPDKREAYTVVIPPPNVTGVLHMGHMLNNTIQDVLVRRARMQGKNACWVPGTDHASIATEAKVVNKLRAEGIDKHSLTRDGFLEHAWEWKEKHGGIILDQLKKLGASCDWNRTSFTMDEDYSNSVIQVFIDLYKKDKIYRGVRMVNWDPSAKTAVSDEEVIHKEVQSKLYYLKYFVEGNEEQFLTIATTRPETILGDTAVCINPKDDRFKDFVGKKVIVPLIHRSIPVIEDEYVDMEFGTGALKITPAHDINDYEIGQRHNLASIDIFNDDGTLNEAAEILVGTDRFEARDKIIPLLEDAGNMLKIEDYTNKVGYSERTDAVIEPRLSMQWFMKMKDISKPALDAVMNDEVQFHPSKFKNTYRHWMENIQDWCISRQLWWGHRIPAWYLPQSNDFVVAESEEEAVRLAIEKTGNKELKIEDLRQDEDVLDTWFSSWLWPISVFKGLTKPGNDEINYYYPTNDLVTAPEIMFFWVARMIIAGYEYLGEKPFKNVYFTGIVRDQKRRKMSKSLGNSPDPIKLIHKYGADGVRVGMLLCSPAGGDLLFDESLPEQGRNFASKIWNAFRLVKNWEVDASIPQPEASETAVAWFENRLNEVAEKHDQQYDQFRLSEALMTVYRLFWDEFSSWYLEIIKPAYQQPIDAQTMKDTTRIFDRILHILHPFMPFITEEIWHYLGERKKGDSLMIDPEPQRGSYNKEDLELFEQAKEVVSGIRTVRKEKNIAMKDSLELFVNTGEDQWPAKYEAVIMKLGNISKMDKPAGNVDNATSFLVRTHELFIPVGDLIDTEAELEKLKAELEYTQGFLKTVMKKLGNERFVNNAPANVVEAEQKKKADAELKIQTLEQQISNLS
ncbi:MAG: valine--tRNA ligase [Salinivirgaceae bacterium]|jgi:valyl-tRNA synthetase|nr:valine--tRNA ligase [Salinivirgaceae bacterium]